MRWHRRAGVARRQLVADQRVPQEFAGLGVQREDAGVAVPTNTLPRDGHALERMEAGRQACIQILRGLGFNA